MAQESPALDAGSQEEGTNEEEAPNGNGDSEGQDLAAAVSSLVETLKEKDSGNTRTEIEDVEDGRPFGDPLGAATSAGAGGTRQGRYTRGPAWK